MLAQAATFQTKSFMLFVLPLCTFCHHVVNLSCKFPNGMPPRPHTWEQSSSSSGIAGVAHAWEVGGRSELGHGDENNWGEHSGSDDVMTETPLAWKVKPAGTSQASTLPPVSGQDATAGTQRDDADADSKTTAVGVPVPDLSTHALGLPGFHSTIISCLGLWFLPGDTHPVLHRDIGRLRQCSKSIWGISRYDESWFAELGKCSCRCGRCEARWLTNGWVCRPLWNAA